MSVYLNGNPARWLMNECGQEMRYLCVRDIFAPVMGGKAVNEEYEKLRASREYGIFFSATGDGVLGDRKRFDLVGRGAMSRFAEAVARGYDRREPAVRQTAGFISQKCRGDSGGFIMNWRPPIEAACVTGAMVRRLLEAGFDDDSTEHGMAWIRTRQRHDGGWLHCPIAGSLDVVRLLLLRKAGTGLSREYDHAVGSCVFATFECLMALIEYGERRGTREEAADRALDFLLENRLFTDSLRGATTVCAAGGRHSDFSRPAYSVFLQYDIVSGLIAVARAGRFGDGRENGAFNSMLSLQNPDGSFPPGRGGPGMPGGGRRTGRDPWVTLNALRFMTRAGLVRPEDLI
ncbi:MAG: hypothetical protein KBA15_04660 [Spirochaetes bacterium]|nr:hypothetical protein [Spirochaetota bacterium]